MSVSRSTLVVASGEIDIMTVDAFEAELRDAVQRSDVVVDLTEVSFFGAAAIRVLLQVGAEGATRGHSLVICALRPQHRRLLARLDLLDQLVCPE
jgi:anti-anti-sigma factor